MKKYIIYKMQDGVPVDIQGPTSKKDGYLSIECDSKIRKQENVNWEAIKTIEVKNILALQIQKQKCIEELNKTQYIVNGDCDYPQVDIDAEQTRRKKIKAIMRGTEVVEISERSFSE